MACHKFFVEIAHNFYIFIIWKMLLFCSLYTDFFRVINSMPFFAIIASNLVVQKAYMYIFHSFAMLWWRACLCSASHEMQIKCILYRMGHVVSLSISPHSSIHQTNEVVITVRYRSVEIPVRIFIHGARLYIVGGVELCIYTKWPIRIVQGFSEFSRRRLWWLQFGNCNCLIEFSFCYCQSIDNHWTYLSYTNVLIMELLKLIASAKYGFSPKMKPSERTENRFIKESWIPIFSSSSSLSWLIATKLFLSYIPCTSNSTLCGWIVDGSAVKIVLELEFVWWLWLATQDETSNNSLV